MQELKQRKLIRAKQKEQPVYIQATTDKIINCC